VTIHLLNRRQAVTIRLLGLLRVETIRLLSRRQVETIRLLRLLRAETIRLLRRRGETIALAATMPQWIVRSTWKM
jgi:hypothetical protein